ncbi:hypothetical protein [Streptomyces violascens]|uniref:hypothetical protein n=1 Tax=Streptomyces violascens TaxID=67381 RepID=UPI0036581DD9
MTDDFKFKEVKRFRQIVHGCNQLEWSVSATLAVMAESGDWDDKRFKEAGGFASITIGVTALAGFLGVGKTSIRDKLKQAEQAGWLVSEERPGATTVRKIVYPTCCRTRRRPADECSAPKRKRGGHTLKSGPTQPVPVARSATPPDRPMATPPDHLKDTPPGYLETTKGFKESNLYQENRTAPQAVWPSRNEPTTHASWGAYFDALGSVAPAGAPVPSATNEIPS